MWEDERLQEPVTPEQPRNVRSRWVSNKKPPATGETLRQKCGSAGRKCVTFKVQSCPGFDSDSCETGRLVWSYRVLTESVWTYLALRSAYVKWRQSTLSHISNTTTMFCFVPSTEMMRPQKAAVMGGLFQTGRHCKAITEILTNRTWSQVIQSLSG